MHTHCCRVPCQELDKQWCCKGACGVLALSTLTMMVVSHVDQGWCLALVQPQSLGYGCSVDSTLGLGVEKEARKDSGRWHLWTWEPVGQKRVNSVPSLWQLCWPLCYQRWKPLGSCAKQVSGGGTLSPSEWLTVVAPAHLPCSQLPVCASALLVSGWSETGACPLYKAWNASEGFSHWLPWEILSSWEVCSWPWAVLAWRHEAGEKKLFSLPSLCGSAQVVCSTVLWNFCSGLLSCPRAVFVLG